ncbi:uncharacterized protein LOC122083979 [Macadamia integrifolia]|uniref:uncharacterized protein LOC122083979 n=1 Tax=Macadamia integrifolia TaxID=60698 RepID=UPI001C4ED163|nr:uncharacterized protein LOC122083979 [Macadamia integrifolia]
MTIMEGISSSLCKGIKGKWNRKDYKRLDGSHRFRRRTIRVVELASSASQDGVGQDQNQNQGGGRRRRFWRIKVTPKLKIFARVNSPKKFFQRLRDAYVKIMLGFANSRMFLSGYGGGRAGFGMRKPALKEYDEKVIVEIYKSLMAQGLVPGDAARLATVTATATAATPIGIAA